MLKLKKIDLLTEMTISTINQDTDVMTTKNKEGWFVLRSEGCFMGWLYVVWEGRVCLDAGMGEEEGEIGEGMGGSVVIY